MDISTFEEIVSILAKFGRPDLIDEFNQSVCIDKTYDPSSDRIRERLRGKEFYSEEEGSASDESNEYTIDEQGFHQLT